MKNLTYILFAVCCVVLCGCGMTEPWKDWESEGTMSENRLRPSEVKPILYGAEAWKVSLQGTTLYFQFDEGGTVISNTDKTILKGQVESTYYLDYRGEDAILLTLNDGGALQYLPDNSEKTFVITAYAASGITARGGETGKEMNLVPVTTAELRQAMEEKRLAIIAYNKEQSLELLKNELSNGVLRDASTRTFMAHYTIACDADDNWTINLAWLEEGKVKHQSCDITLDTTGDEKAVLNIAGLPLPGAGFQAIYYGYDTGAMSTNSADVVVDLNKSSDWLGTYTSAWSTHILDRDNIHEAFAGLPGQVEFDDRTPRNIVVCPGDGTDWWYIFFVVSASADDATGCVYLRNTGVERPFGGEEGSVRTVYAVFMDFCFSTDGLWIYSDSDGYTYVISPTTDKWFRMR